MVGMQYLFFVRWMQYLHCIVLLSMVLIYVSCFAFRFFCAKSWNYMKGMPCMSWHVFTMMDSSLRF
jgi:hypothetical protein